MTQKLTVVVTGSTGKQGGAVARGLLERGHKVRAVTRDPNSKQAKLLANAGAALVAASLGDAAGIKEALEGATSLFAMTTPSGGMDAEIRQGIAAADAAKAAGVHLVFTSVGSANQQTGIPHFDSKYLVEKHIARVGVRATILAPVAFMENLHFVKEQLVKGSTRRRSMLSASAWARMPSRCTNGSTAAVLRWIAPRFAVNFPTLPSTTSSWTKTQNWSGLHV
jgi:uncharacterized protein YbjT (DUF2867 family)